MLTASPSPRLHSGSSPASSRPALSSSPRSQTRSSSHSRYDTARKSSSGPSPIVRPRSSHVDAAPQPTPVPPQWSQDKSSFYVGSGSSALSSTPPPPSSRRNMVDAGTQYSPPPGYRSPTTVPTKRPSPSAPAKSIPESASNLAHSAVAVPVDVAMPALPPVEVLNSSSVVSNNPQSPKPKRQSSVSGPNESNITATQQAESLANESAALGSTAGEDQGRSKRARGEGPPVKVMPIKYETCDTRELVILISSMLMELIRYNDAIPLKDGALTRFHSRAPPGISVLDYLQRLTTHATLSPPILLSMVYYIDRLCALYPAFTISSLTVHRFLITSATVASKGLSDSFWTNKTYARVGGVSIKELATLELEFLGRVQWRIVPKPEILIDYYRSLVERSPGYELEMESASS